MILRPYQKKLVAGAVKALAAKRNTLAVAPTGAGKTIMLSALGREVGGRQVVIQHRDELVSQNMAKFQKVAPDRSVSLYTADCKSWRGDTVFSMIQTLARESNLKTMPPIDLAIIDEAHHVAAASYQRVIEAIREKNPNAAIAGFTATPERGDRKGLRSTFDNVAGQITIKELIDLGFLVPPTAYVVDVEGVREGLSHVRKLASDFDMGQVEKVMNKAAVNNEVIRHWRERAGDRRTIVFCSTVAHAEDVTKAFRDTGVTAEMVTGESADGERRAVLRRLSTGETQVVINVAVLTEGFDCPPVSCVVMLRPCSFKSTMIQMIGRGLRTVNPQEYPGLVKKDCVVLDFGSSILTHGDIHTGVNLDGRDGDADTEGEAPRKVCPSDPKKNGEPYLVPDPNGAVGCGAEVPAGCKVCPLCGFEFHRLVEDEGGIERVTLARVDILGRSPFKWVDLFGTGKVLVACGFEATAIIATKDGETWVALGKMRTARGLATLAVGGELQAQAAADDFLRENETEGTAHKSRRWLTDPPTDKQLVLLARVGYQANLEDFNLTKYAANAHLNFQWARGAVERAVFAI